MNSPIRVAPLFRSAPLALWALAACVGSDAAPASGQTATDSSLAALHRSLSEPGGFFDTDNLISNESSYLHVVGALEEMDVEGGAYIGVGPDQNFSYIATIRPSVAFLIDVRRDNTLQHLLFKALFELAPTRVEYLSLLHGVDPPPQPGQWEDRSIEALVEFVESQPANEEVRSRARARVDSAVATFGFELSDDDLATLQRFHGVFIQSGLSLRFTSLGRPPRWYYPTFRQLLLERDLQGRQASYLSARDAYRFLRTMQIEDRIVPVVGDLAGPKALRGIAEEVRQRGEVVSAIYTSNVEFYLFSDRTFAAFADNVGALPRSDRSVLIRSYFPNQGNHPHTVAGYYSTQSMQTLNTFVEAAQAEGYGSYWNLVTRDAIDVRTVPGSGGEH